MARRSWLVAGQACPAPRRIAPDHQRGRDRQIGPEPPAGAPHGQALWHVGRPAVPRPLGAGSMSNVTANDTPAGKGRKVVLQLLLGMLSGAAGMMVSLWLLERGDLTVK